MGFTAIAAAAVLMLLAFLAGLHVASALGLLSFSLMAFFGDRPLWSLLGLIAWNTNTSFILTAIPLFILMGNILLRSGLSERLYQVLALWLRPLPGGLMHSNIAASAAFAAMSGSSVATAATIGAVALPSFKDRQYDERLVLGSLAAGGTLGILIPPSITLIVYGVLMEVSIGRLYMAGLVPGVMLSLIFMGVILVCSLIRPAVAPRERPAPWRERIAALIHMLPTGALIFLVLGTIYAGIATPTEAAAFGVVGAFVLALGAGKVNSGMIQTVCISTARTTAMVMLILTSALILNSVLAFLGAPQAISQAVVEYGLSPAVTMTLIVLLYIVLGTFMDGFAMMVTTIPVILPILRAMEIDLIWFGVIAVILTEAALISPPHGLNLYVIHGVRERGPAAAGPRGTIVDVYIGVLPFFLALIIGMILIVVFPQIALWLPDTMW